jgi:hypothetical protein
MKVKAASKSEYEWKKLNDNEYLYAARTGRVVGEIIPFYITPEGCLWESRFDEEHIGNYVNIGYAKAATLEAATLHVTKKTTKRT